MMSRVNWMECQRAHTQLWCGIKMPEMMGFLFFSYAIRMQFHSSCLDSKKTQHECKRHSYLHADGFSLHFVGEISYEMNSNAIINTIWSRSQSGADDVLQLLWQRLRIQIIKNKNKISRILMCHHSLATQFISTINIIVFDVRLWENGGLHPYHKCRIEMY